MGKGNPNLILAAGTQVGAANDLLYGHVIYRCVVGSRAYGLDGEESDVDRRGMYLPPAELHWSLGGVPEQLERRATDEVYWEIGKFLRLGLKANPNVLECLYTPLVEEATEIAREVLAMREGFLSQGVYLTYGGYVRGQFERLKGVAPGEVKWKHVMHVMRLLLSGVTILRDGYVPVRVDGEDRARLLAIRRGEVSLAEIGRWKKELERKLDEAAAGTRLPKRPDYDGVNRLLIKARRSVV